MPETLPAYLIAERIWSNPRRQHWIVFQFSSVSGRRIGAPVPIVNVEVWNTTEEDFHTSSV